MSVKFIVEQLQPICWICQINAWVKVFKNRHGQWTKFVEDSLYKIWSDHFKFLKAVFHKFCLVRSWIPWPTYGPPSLWEQSFIFCYSEVSFHHSYLSISTENAWNVYINPFHANDLFLNQKFSDVFGEYRYRSVAWNEPIKKKWAKETLRDKIQNWTKLDPFKTFLENKLKLSYFHRLLDTLHQKRPDKNHKHHKIKVTKVLPFKGFDELNLFYNFGWFSKAPLKIGLNCELLD